MLIDNVKILLGINDDLQDELLEVIEKITIQHFKLKTKLSEVPEHLEFVIVEVMIKRFNRIGAEGMSSKTIEGASVSFSQSDFDEYDLFSKKGIKFL